MPLNVNINSSTSTSCNYYIFLLKVDAVIIGDSIRDLRVETLSCYPEKSTDTSSAVRDNKPPE